MSSYLLTCFNSIVKIYNQKIVHDLSNQDGLSFILNEHNKTMFLYDIKQGKYISKIYDNDCKIELSDSPCSYKYTIKNGGIINIVLENGYLTPVKNFTFTIKNYSKEADMIYDTNFMYIDKINNLEKKIDKIETIIKFNNPVCNVPKATGIQREYQLMCSNILQTVHNICEENKINYWISYGTLLGAVRHKGIIPWDDDIDICMMHSDLLKLIDILNKQENSLFYFANTVNDPLYKIYGKKNLVNQNNKKEYKPFIDIFSFYFLEQDITTKIFSDNLKLVRNERKQVPNLNDDYKIKNFIEIANKYNAKLMSDKNYGSIFRGYEFPYQVLWNHDYNDIFPLIKLPFENFYVYAPNNYQKILSERYGNYMEYPDIFARHRVF